MVRITGSLTRPRRVFKSSGYLFRQVLAKFVKFPKSSEDFGNCRKL